MATIVAVAKGIAFVCNSTKCYGHAYCGCCSLCLSHAESSKIECHVFPICENFGTDAKNQVRTRYMEIAVSHV